MFVIVSLNEVNHYHLYPFCFTLDRMIGYRGISAVYADPHHSTKSGGDDGFDRLMVCDARARGRHRNVLLLVLDHVGWTFDV